MSRLVCGMVFALAVGIPASLSAGEPADAAGDKKPATLRPAPAESEFLLIPPGEFQMGDPYNEGREDERPVHKVYVDAFYMAKYPVTNQEMAEVMQWAWERGKLYVIKEGFAIGMVRKRRGGLADRLRDTWNFDFKRNRGRGVDDDSQVLFDETHDGDKFRVYEGREHVAVAETAWLGAMAYGLFRNEMEGREQTFDPDTCACDFTKTGYRMPTEAEFEKAARGGLDGHHFPWPSQDGTWKDHIDGTKANYSGSGDPFEKGRRTSDAAWFQSPVGYFDGSQVIAGKPGPMPDMKNGYGLYDVAGNICQWCYDVYDPKWYANPDASKPNSVGPAEGQGRVCRAGSCFSGPETMRCSWRSNVGWTKNWSGMRVARSISPQCQEAVKALAALRGKEAGDAVAARLKTAPPDVKVVLLDLLVQTGGQEALATFEAAIRDPDEAVRVAAWGAQTELRRAEVIPALLQAIAKSSGAEQHALVNVLARLRGDAATRALVEVLGSAKPEGRLRAAEMLVLRRSQLVVTSAEVRGNTGEAIVAASTIESSVIVPALLKAAASDPDGTVRAMALHAASRLVAASDLAGLVRLLKEARKEDDVRAACDALDRACRRMQTDAKDNIARYAQPLLEGLPGTNGTVEASLLRGLAILGGEKPLAALAAAAAGRDAAAQDAAVSALAEEYQDLAGAPVLLGIVREPP